MGKRFSDEHKEKLSERKVGNKQSQNARLKNSASQKLRYSDPLSRKKTSDTVKMALHRPDVRKRHIKALAETRWLGKSFDRGQIELLNKWNSMGFEFEPNYQIHTDEFLCYIDGYDKKNNVVIEYDGKYHTSLRQKERDLVRQNKIVEILNPKRFWRYDVVNKQWTNVVGGK
jgi:very-short-patch-repair endonuclease